MKKNVKELQGFFRGDDALCQQLGRCIGAIFAGTRGGHGARMEVGIIRHTKLHRAPLARMLFFGRCILIGQTAGPWITAMGRCPAC